MARPTKALIVCVFFLCVLKEAVHSLRGHCADGRCFALFQEPANFTGAQKRCKDWGGQLFGTTDVATLEKTLPSSLSGNYWLDWAKERGPQNCSSIAVSKERNVTALRESCSKKLSGFLCQYDIEEPCGGVPAGKQVTYRAPMGFEVHESVTFPQGTIAVVKAVGAEYPDSKHLCVSGDWLRAPWKCEVLGGGCEDGCDASNTCTCPGTRPLQPNKISCAVKDPCTECAHTCEREGDDFVCKCARGYRLAKDGKSCVDVDECKEGNPCTGEALECQNTQGHFACECKDGFVLDDGVCVDASICEKCEHLLCDKVNGVYGCQCRTGYRVSDKDATKCERHCAEANCSAYCIPNPDEKQRDRLQCFCPEGFILDQNGVTNVCHDIDECEQQDPCDGAKCENLFGGYRCLCDENKCEPGDEEEASGWSATFPTPPSARPAAVPYYVKTGSVLGIAVFLLLCAALLVFLVHHAAKRCGRFELSSIKHSNIDIFYLQQVTTETYKRLSFDKSFKSDSQTP